MGTDALVILASVALAWSARSVTTSLDILTALPFALFAVVLFWVVSALFGLYHRIWRYASAGEVVVIAGVAALSTIALILADLYWPGQRPVPLGVVPFTGLFAFVGFTSVRFRRRVWTGSLWRWQALGGHHPSQRVLIVGAGEAGQLLAWRLLTDRAYIVVGFMDDDQKKQGMRIHGVKVLGNRHLLLDIVARHRVDLIAIALYNISDEDFREILDICEETDARMKVIPNVYDLLEESSSRTPLRDVTVEDLLGREPVEIDREGCRALIASKTILVTGAAGSIGSELCKQILALGPLRLVAMDNNESGLHDLQMELRLETSLDPQPEVIPLVGDITNLSKVRRQFEVYRPQVVFHAAAYKHVPLMEEYPDEAVRVNLQGTMVVAEMATLHGAEHFVFVSTDKAVNPISVMGATKRLGEMMVMCADSLFLDASHPRQPVATEKQSTLNAPVKTLFTAVRFGNVLRSRGSVVPIFERQIERGGPVTITDPNMTRYFMSVSEAASLVIQAAALSEPGAIFMLDMGQRISIEGLARRLMRLRGLRPDIDVKIEYIGIRPGEKIHEELVGDDEEWSATSHPHVFRVRSRRTISLQMSQLDELVALAEQRQKEELVSVLRRLVMDPTRPTLK